MAVVMLLIGSEDQEGALIQAAASVEGRSVQSVPRDEYRSNPAPARQVQRVVTEPEQVIWADDSELIDDTSGFDPTPAEDAFFDEGDY